MVNLNVIHSFLKDPLTDKLINRYVESEKTRKAIETSVRVVEILMVAMPLIESATKGMRDMMKKSKPRAAASHGRRLPAHAAQGVH